MKISDATATQHEFRILENIECMYDLVYEQMISAGLARRLAPSEQYWIDKNGDKVHNEENAVGLKVEVEITHPDWIIFGDEVGIDICMKDDGHVGGQKFVSTKYPI